MTPLGVRWICDLQKAISAQRISVLDLLILERLLCLGQSDRASDDGVDPGDDRGGESRGGEFLAGESWGGTSWDDGPLLASRSFDQRVYVE